MLNLKLERFEGPFDLLLKLIEQEDLSISEVSISKVTEQFLDFVKNSSHINPVELADYLHFAAKLILIKSQSLLPTEKLAEEEEASIEKLQESLEIFNFFKQLSKHIKKLIILNKQSYTRTTVFEEKISFFPDNNVTIDTLHRVIQKIANEINEIKTLPKARIKEAVSIADKIDHIRILIEQNVTQKFFEITKDKDAEEAVITFLAILELVKMRLVNVNQTDHFDDIEILKI